MSDPILCSYLDQQGKATVGLALYAMSHLLGDMTAEQIASLGVTMAARAVGCGLMLPEELDGLTPDDALVAFHHRMSAFIDMDRQLGG